MDTASSSSPPSPPGAPGAPGAPSAERVISYGGIDPNIVVERDGQLCRRIVQHSDGRWAGLDVFIHSPAFRSLMDAGWVVYHDLAHGIPSPLPGGAPATLYPIARIPHFCPPRWWTDAQYAAAYALVARINATLSTTAPGWLAADCHADNIAWLNYSPVYADTGSFSCSCPEMARDHFAAALTRLGLAAPASWEGAIRLLDSYAPSYSATEWDAYDPAALPSGRAALTPSTPEHHLLLSWLAPLSGDLLDLGCNQGKLSRLFAAHGFTVLSADISPACVDACWHTARSLSLPITSVCLDIAREADVRPLASSIVVASSITHHLFRQGMDWPAQERLFRSLARSDFLIEQIEPADPCIQRWRLPPSYSTSAFDAAFSAWPRVAEARPEMPTRRWLHLRPPAAAAAAA
jgi:SAM-dependent methyltransferase